MAHGSKSSRNKATTATGRVVRVVQIRRRSVRRILGPAAIAQQKLSDEREQRLRYEGTSVYSSHTPLGNKAFLFVELNTEEQRALQALRDIPEEAGPSDDWEMAGEVLAGNLPIDVSHAGGEFEAIRNLEKDLRQEQKYVHSYLITFPD